MTKELHLCPIHGAVRHSDCHGCPDDAPPSSKQSAIPYTLTLHGRVFNVGEILLLLDLNAKFTDGPGEAAALIRALLQPSETAAPHPDTARLDWLQAWPDRFANIDRITSVRGLFNGFATLREAIDNEVVVRPAPNGEAPR